MRFFISFVLLMISMSSWSQFDRGNNSLYIPPNQNPKPEPIPTPKPEEPKKDPREVPPSIFGEPSKEKKLDLESTINFGAPKPQFVNPGDEIAKKLNEGKGEGGNFKELRVNKQLGEFRVSSSKISIKVRDVGAYVDGEVLAIYVNDKKTGHVLVEGSTTIHEVKTQPGFNKIDIQVVNMGWAYPSSVYFEIVDEKGKVLVSDTWFSETGFKSSVIIVNE